MQRRNNRKRLKKKRIKKLIVVLTAFLVIGLVFVAAKMLPVNKTTDKGNSSSQPKQSVSQSSSNKNQAVAKSSSNQSEYSNWLTAKEDNQLPILMFHYVSSLQGDLVDSNWMPTSVFEENLKALKEAGYTTLSSADAKKVLTTKTKPSDKMVWLTFDDGSLTVYRDIFPLLKKYNMHATAFIVTNFVNNKQAGILTWEQIKEMKESGLVDFESHSANHSDLGKITSAAMEEELKSSKDELDSKLAQKTEVICYPAGGYNQETLNIAGNLGYKFGLLDPGRNGAVAKAASLADGLLTLPRFRMMSTTTSGQLLNMLAESETYNSKNRG